MSAALLDRSLENSILLGAAAARLRIELAPGHIRRVGRQVESGTAPERAASSLAWDFANRLADAASDLSEQFPDSDPALTQRVLADEIDAYRHWADQVAHAARRPFPYSH